MHPPAQREFRTRSCVVVAKSLLLLATLLVGIVRIGSPCPLPPLKKCLQLGNLLALARVFQLVLPLPLGVVAITPIVQLPKLDELNSELLNTFFGGSMVKPTD